MELTDDSKVDDKPKSAAQLMQSLTKHVHNLPQELFDEIQDLVFSIPPDPIVTVTKNWRPPLAAQISREISDKYTKPYYQNTIFKLKWADIYEWVNVIARGRCHLMQIRLESSEGLDDLGSELTCKRVQDILEHRLGDAMRRVDFSIQTMSREGVPRITKTTGKFRDDLYFRGMLNHMIERVGASLMRHIM